jgi:hypothetical protein
VRAPVIKPDTIKKCSIVDVHNLDEIVMKQNDGKRNGRPGYLAMRSLAFRVSDAILFISDMI